MITREQIQNIVDRIVAICQPEKVILFGSYAYGKPNEDSDLDLCVVKNDPRHGILKSKEIRMQLRGHGIPMDIFCFRPEELEDITPYQLVHLDIAEKGIVLYEQKRPHPAGMLIRPVNE